MKVVLDTNVVMSGLLKAHGNPVEVLRLALAGVIQVCHNQRILAEYAEVLVRPRFKFDPRRVREVLIQLEVDGLAVEAEGQGGLDLRDPDDEPFLAVALAAKADFLVTGNLSDYPPGKRRGCAVLSPTEFMEAWRNRYRDPKAPGL
jgi:putative PIN family toxin of toxin-antitoxin system